MNTAASTNIESYIEYHGQGNKAYVNRLFEVLHENGRLSQYELKRLSEDDRESQDYRRATFGFRRPLFVESARDVNDHNGYGRYYTTPVCKRYHLCKEWYFNEGHVSYNLDKIQKWARRMVSSSSDVSAV